MATRADVNINVGGLDRARRDVDASAARAEAAANRLNNPRGATSGGGGRGGFKGALKDFLTRDEIVGRTGTISRLVSAGNVAGTLLAFQSIEELFRNFVLFARGDRNFIEVLQGQLKFLIPGIIREQIPELVRIFQGIEARDTRLAKAAQEALENPYVQLDPITGERTIRVLRSDGPTLDRLAPREAMKWRQSREFRRFLEEAAERPRQ